MRAIGFTTPGGADRLTVLDLPEPVPGPGQVRVAVRAAAVNPTDTALRAGALPRDLQPPYVPGMDLAGVVDAVGEGVELSVGDRVAAVVSPRRPGGGAYAERVLVDEDAVAPLPAGMDLVAAATLPLNALTARRGLQLLDLPQYGTVAVTGAAGGVGGYGVELAKHLGYRVVADAKDTDRDLVAGFGADTVLNRGASFPAAVRKAEPGGVDGLLDAAVMGRAVLPAVRDGGVVAAVRRFDGEPERNIRVYRVRVEDYVHDGAGLRELVGLAERGVLSLRVAEAIPAERAPEAHRRLEAGGVRGRLVLTF